MKRWLVSLCMALALVACKDEKKETAQADNRPVIRIGASLMLSGDYARIGQANQKAILMALDKWKTKNTKYDYEVLFEDDSFSARKAAVIANKFINADKTKAIISTWGVVAPVIADIADKNKVISMTCAGMSEVAKPYYSFNHFTQNDKLAEKLIPLLKQKNIKKVVLVSTNASAYVEKMDVFKSILPQNGIEILATELYAPGETDFRLSIQKLERLNPDAYINFVLMPGTVNYINQFDQITQGKREMIGLHVFNEMPQKYWPLVNGRYSVRDSSGTAEFSKMFQEKTGIENQPCTGNQFDNMDLLIWAFENTPVREGDNVPDTEDVVKTLHSIKNWKGAVGNLIVDDTGIINSDAILEIYEDGKPVEVKD